MGACCILLGQNCRSATTHAPQHRVCRKHPVIKTIQACKRHHCETSISNLEFCCCRGLKEERGGQTDRRSEGRKDCGSQEGIASLSEIVKLRMELKDPAFRKMLRSV
jgi:hypothetical protein